MNVLFFGIALLIAAFFIHFVIWKIRIPMHQKSTLILIFSAVLMAGAALLFIFKHKVSFFGITAPQTVYEYLQLCIFFISLELAYMVTYSALEADSPSLVIVMDIYKAGAGGLDEKIFKKEMSNDVLIMPRMRDMVFEKMAYLDNGKYKLTPKGLTIVRVFTLYRKILKTAQKGG
jgi:hypothetical protein